MKKQKISVMLILILILSLCSACANTKDSSVENVGATNKENGETGNINFYGNTNSNIVNQGLASIQDDWIFYCTPDGLFKVKTDGTGEKNLLPNTDGENCIYSINAAGDWVYYTNFTGGMHKLYRTKTDGSKTEELGAGYNKIRVVYNSIYCWDRPNVYTMHLEGTDELSLLRESASSDFTINFTEDYIYLCCAGEDGKDGIYRIKYDGTEKKLLYSGRTDYLVVEDGYVFFQGHRDHQLYRISVDGGERELVLEDAALWGVNVTDGWVYYCNRGDYGMYKIRLDGTEKQQLSDGRISDINVVGDWIYYINHDLIENEKVHCRMKTDGTQQQQLGVRNETYDGESEPVTKPGGSTGGDLSTDDLAEYAGTYTAYDTLTNNYGGAELFPDITLNADGTVIGGTSSIQYAGTVPTAITKNDDGSYQCAVGETNGVNQFFVVYPIGVSDGYFDTDVIRIAYHCVGGGAMYMMYYKN